MRNPCDFGTLDISKFLYVKFSYVKSISHVKSTFGIGTLHMHVKSISHVKLSNVKQEVLIREIRSS
jgi:hypothetical protein